jgi:TonB family protein
VTWNFYIRDFGLSLFFHMAIFAMILLFAPESKRKYTPVEINIVRNENLMYRDREEIIDLTRNPGALNTSRIHRAKKGVQKKEFKPVVGVTEESVAEGGGVSVPIGNTLMGVPENRVNENVEFAPLYSVTRMPSFRVQVKPEYPVEARRLGIEGVVVLEVAISREGKVLEAKIIEDPGFGLGEAARTAIMQSEFEPALQDSTPVAVRVRIPVRFRLVD